MADDKTSYKNATMLQAFEWYIKPGGHHWKEFTSKVQELSDAGITAAWLPPPFKASSPMGNGYDVYDLYDLGEFDQKGSVPTKWGTKDEYVKAIQTAKQAGIDCYIDAVLNHKAAADFTETFKAMEVDKDDRTKDVSGEYDIQGWTGFDFPGRKGKYSEFKWTFNHFTGVDYDDKGKKNSIFRIKGDGKNWSRNVDREKGNFDYLMFADIDHSHPDVRNHLNEWAKWIIAETGAEGFRFDAIKHMDKDFVSEFVKSVRQATGKGQMFSVGEFWKDSTQDMENYLNGFGTQFSLFDTPLHYNFKEASELGNSYDLTKIFQDTLVQRRPVDAVTLVDNHDTQPYQALESWVQSWFKPLAYALILLRNDGYPCVFWGDLYGCNGDGDNAHPVPPMSQLMDFIRCRKWFSYGETRDYFDHPNCIGWVRAGDPKNEYGKDGCAIVISNGDQGQKRMEVGKEHAGEKWTDVLGWYQGEITIDGDGWGDFKCPAKSVSIWTKSDAEAKRFFKK